MPASIFFWGRLEVRNKGGHFGKKKVLVVMSDSAIGISLTDPWSVAAMILFGLLATVAIYRTTRVCCTCTVETVEVAEATRAPHRSSRV